MAKDINIHVRALGADEAKRDIDDVARAAGNIGPQVSSSSKQAASGVEEATNKIGGFSSSISGWLTKLKDGVTGFVGAWLGLQGVIRIVEKLNEKLQKTAQLQKEIYQDSMESMEAGARIEGATGTVGGQEDWAGKMLGLYQAGATPQQAEQMLKSGKSSRRHEVSDEILEALAPVFGRENLSTEAIDKFIKISRNAKIEQTPDAFLEFFGKLKIGQKAADVTDINEFISSFQKSATPFLLQGGSLQGALETYSILRSKTSNESQAERLFERLIKISNMTEKEQQRDIQRVTHQTWEQVPVDKRLDVLLQYVTSTSNKRLEKYSWSPEEIFEIKKLSPSQADETRSQLKQSLEDNTIAEQIRKQGEDFQKSAVGTQRKNEAELKQQRLAESDVRDWQEYYAKGKKEFENKLLHRKDSNFHFDSDEPYVESFVKILEDIHRLEKKYPEKKEKLEKLREEVMNGIGERVVVNPTSWFRDSSSGEKKGLQYIEELNEIMKPQQPAAPVVPQQQPEPQKTTGPVTNNFIQNFDSSIRYYPQVGDLEDRGCGPRFPA